MNKNKFEYKTLEQEIMELWNSRGMEVQTIQFQIAKKSRLLGEDDILEWIIHAKRKKGVKK